MSCVIQGNLGLILIRRPMSQAFRGCPTSLFQCRMQYAEMQKCRNAECRMQNVEWSAEGSLGRGCISPSLPFPGHPPAAALLHSLVTGTKRLPPGTLQKHSCFSSRFRMHFEARNVPQKLPKMVPNPHKMCSKNRSCFEEVFRRIFRRFWCPCTLAN